MVLVKSSILQVAGYKNSGKTTFIEKLLEQFDRIGKVVVTIKSHGHGGQPKTYETKDSDRHLTAGAVASLVEGDGRMILQAERKGWTLDEKIRLISYFHPELIIIEGHKRESYPKIVLIREQKDLNLLNELANIIMVLYWDINMKENEDFPSFQINDLSAILWIMEYVSIKT
ncbi:molybdopterin-guanine dinucleotide biosynthesis protein B [Bacillus sp. 03113]|uniref:molybdopterin-guanine dinucleotide biosynthesis protein B n=1 Tax=Bacillus sp. 03113 TaxID=2578211 RepID=UPI001144FF10|nr:molybdopterin-guanine dinucleotide biosynthesis protein B [Bacillus sp. 03113]